MNNTPPELINDLEIYEHIFPVLNKTITKYGSLKLKEILSIIIYDLDLLERRQSLLKTIMSNIDCRNVIIDTLKEIKKYEKDIHWLFQKEKEKEKHEDTQKGTENDLYYNYDLLNNEFMLDYGNYL